MRVIAGKYRGRPLRSLRGTDIRPTSDRLRETLFNVLTAGNPGALEGSVWLDLFAGTGAVGIEALSRGAKQVYFVETSAPAAKLIEQNLQSLGILSGYKILRDDLSGVLWRLQREHVAADVVFLDPPYRMQHAYEETLTALSDSTLVWALSLVVAEHEKACRRRRSVPRPALSHAARLRGNPHGTVRFNLGVGFVTGCGRAREEVRSRR